jgi:hypothetical protein
MSDDRAERLREKRNQASEKAQETAESANEGEQQPAEPESSDTSEESAEPVKVEQVGTYMYLPKNQQKELSRLYNLLKAEYEYEYDQNFEKNRHFYPLVIQYGIDGLDSLDALEIQERLSGLDLQNS